jgi:hypothetical protein
MIILSKIDYEGNDIQRDLEKLQAISSRIQQQLGGRIDGPYLPQDSTLLYIFHVDNYEWLNRAGRLWLAEVSKANLPFTPKSYEVAVTPKEFFG